MIQTLTSDAGSTAVQRTPRARVVVVGAGAIGLAVALQLRRAGVEGVVVVDRNSSAGMGSTSRANGGVRAQFTTPVNIAFSQFTIEKLRELHEQSAGQVGFKSVGYLFLTGTDAGEIALRRAWELQRSLGVGVAWLSAAGVIERAPFVNVDGLAAATFCASDGIIDPPVSRAHFGRKPAASVRPSSSTPRWLGSKPERRNAYALRPVISRPSSSSTPPGRSLAASPQPRASTSPW